MCIASNTGSSYKLCVVQVWIRRRIYKIPRYIFTSHVAYLRPYVKYALLSVSIAKSQIGQLTPRKDHAHNILQEPKK